jgi:hypothetical protein
MFCADPRFGNPTKQWAFDQFDVRSHEVFKFRPPGSIKIFNNGNSAVREEGLAWVELLIQKHVPTLAIVQHGKTCAAYGKEFASVADEVKFQTEELASGLSVISKHFGSNKIKIVAAIMVPHEDGIHTYAEFPLSDYRP